MSHSHTPSLIATDDNPATIAVSTDLLVENVHFFADVEPDALGHKAAAVNLSDLAAMAADPLWVSVTVYHDDRGLEWRQHFSAGVRNLCNACGCAPHVRFRTDSTLRVSVQAGGRIPDAEPLRRDTANAGDRIVVTGTLGDAGAALALRQQNSLDYNNTSHRTLLERLERPTPRIEVGQALRGIASAGLDLSDGLAGDIRHMCNKTLGARINPAHLPLSQALRETVDLPQSRALALAAGDDYELCFAAPAARVAQAISACESLGVSATIVGEMRENGGEIEISDSGLVAAAGFQHF